MNEAQEKNKMHTELAGTDLKITVLSGFLEGIISAEIILSKIGVENWRQELICKRTTLNYRQQNLK